MKTNGSIKIAWAFQFRLLISVVVLSLTVREAPAQVVERQLLPNRLPANARRLPVGRLESSRQLSVAIGLPLRNLEALTNLIQQLYAPASTNFHRYLTPEKFTELFGPTKQDYETVSNFLSANGMTITRTHPNRVLLDVSGPVADIEKIFHVKMGLYQHPVEARQFFAPDVAPSLDLATPLACVAGLDNFRLPHPNHKPVDKTRAARPHDGTGPSGAYMGNDFRLAYAPDVTTTGAGQIVGLYQIDADYYDSDILAYEAKAGLRQVPVERVVLGPFTPPEHDIEVTLDIEMVISMAPDLSKVIVYEGFVPHDIINAMADDNVAKQLSCSWDFGGFFDPTMEGIFMQMAAQGQTFFEASGDADAYTDDIPEPEDDPYITIVGGTTLTTEMNGAWKSESVWNWGGGQGSSGGISTGYGIPGWQQGISMSANQGSTTRRNIPDVAMCADNVFVYDSGKTNYQGGTSAAAPLWAAFTALVNQQAAADGKPTVGFINPAIYQIGKGSGYAMAFHDITTGNNANSSSAGKFNAVLGYDLCTGWGTPTGNGLVSALLDYAGPTWVAFGGADAGDGSYWTPYNTLARGANGVQARGTILIKGPGSSKETIRIAKPMTIRAVGGITEIGL
jgi:subtilase family serine protease